MPDPKFPPRDLAPGLPSQDNIPLPLEDAAYPIDLEQVSQRALAALDQLLPSTYVSETDGPVYKALLGTLAVLSSSAHIEALELQADAVAAWARPEILPGTLGTLLFPLWQTLGYPEVDGDNLARALLLRVAELLLQGATPEAMLDGVRALDPGDVMSLQERGRTLALLGKRSGWGPKDAFSTAVLVESRDARGLPSFPKDPAVLLRNAGIVLQALSPAHVKREVQFLFREVLELPTEQAGPAWDLDNNYYDDTRVYHSGLRRIRGTSGRSSPDKWCWCDPDRDFAAVQPGAELRILEGPGSIGEFSKDRGGRGRRRVVAPQTLPVPDDPTERAYTTTPSNLSGYLTCSGGDLWDPYQNFARAVPREQLQILEGPNAGTYRLRDALGGSAGGPLGRADGPAPGARPYAGVLLLENPFMVPTSAAPYEVDCDPAGKVEARRYLEDLSQQVAI